LSFDAAAASVFLYDLDRDALRRTPGATLALFLTDRCPVGCGHCSVAATATGPTVTDWATFAEVVAGVCALPALRVVAVTGGEPFAEPRALRFAVRRLHAAGKAVVLFTSGHWGGRPVSAGTREVLACTATVVLSTDSFHAAALGSRATAAATAAAEAALAAGCHVVVQVLDEPGARDAARTLCPTAEITVVPPLPTGRGVRAFPRSPARPVGALGRCTLLNSPTVRYDGTVTGCCNEAVITGAGPPGLRRAVRDRADVARALDELRADPVLRVMGGPGPAALALLAPGPFRSVCEPCWAVHERVAQDPRAAALAQLVAGWT
ncbi:MAG TPA: radical SAM protein, partial [Pilimelia sp.]|nr:radical SAM protein [Pilimelia sp.]